MYVLSYFNGKLLFFKGVQPQRELLHTGWFESVRLLGGDGYHSERERVPAALDLLHDLAVGAALHGLVVDLKDTVALVHAGHLCGPT